MIRVDRASLSIGSRTILDKIGFEVESGCFFGIIGPNGSGKSTLLKLISGVEKPSAGEVRLEGKRAADYPRRELARWLAMLQQEALPGTGFSVREIVEMGRYPFQNWLGEESGDSVDVVDRVMARLELQGLAERPVDRLSGGERQRVALAKTMVQEPRLLLLDEPTTFLDIGHQVQMMDYIRTWQRECRMTVVAVLHDLNLAALYCDRMLLLNEGRVEGIGTPAELLLSERIARVYGTEPILLKHPVSGVPQILLQAGAEPESRQEPTRSHVGGE